MTPLDRVFNGHPGELDDSVGLMFQLQLHAKKLYGMPFAEGPGTVLVRLSSPGVSF